MEEGEARQQVLHDPPLAGFLAHVSWRPGEGWRLWVNSWTEGHLPTSGHQDAYKRLTWEECSDVLQAEVALRCEWLEL